MRSGQQGEARRPRRQAEAAMWRFQSWPSEPAARRAQLAVHGDKQSPETRVDSDPSSGAWLFPTAPSGAARPLGTLPVVSDPTRRTGCPPHRAAPRSPPLRRDSKSRCRLRVPLPGPLRMGRPSSPLLARRPFARAAPQGVELHSRQVEGTHGAGASWRHCPESARVPPGSPVSPVRWVSGGCIT